jgi:hypothetical protein
MCSDSNITTGFAICRMELLARLRSELKAKLAKQHDIGSQVCKQELFMYK